MGLWPVVGMPSPVFIATYGKYGIGIEAAAMSGTAAASITTANQARICPIYVPDSFIARKLFWFPASQTGNIDIGIYDENYSLIISSGSTPAGTTNVLAEYDIVDTYLSRGIYHLAIAVDTGVASGLFGFGPSLVPLTQINGVALMTSAFPLPNVFVPVKAANSPMYDIGISQRSLVA